MSVFDLFCCSDKLFRSDFRNCSLLLSGSALVLVWVSCTNTISADFKASDKAVLQPVSHPLKNQNPIYDKTLPTIDRQPMYDLFLYGCFRAESA